ncbi:PQQ-dependent sugar dehydrogenase [Sphingomonas sp. So64.6b]|uniref:PQQ-dependent sugar dehydrogenase n=1 Tax=Sphingomonas sp. So64.6b TaxID=2997354 RepID=UPI001603BA27|nr:PQQ-dependent sugar dehydrogenase [Sphingomonas sp. So64.6b]QNA86187.1 PQQ-dependent sugar dehydrogenase [Sphingomonas sp. So64.6b]
MRLLYLSLPIALIACSANQAAPATTSGSLPFIKTVMADFDSPWAMTFLPDERGILVTEKSGALKLLSVVSWQSETVEGVPPVDSDGQGGLMDVVLSPGFAKDRLVYFSFSEKGAGGKGVALARGRLTYVGAYYGITADGADDSSHGTPLLEDVTVIFRAHPYVEGDGHYSGRIVFSPDGQYLFFTNGERQKFDPAQDPKATLGKVLRLTPDGKPAPGNPLAAQGFDPAVWSYGHRNLLGIAFDSAGNLWEQEMGPKGGDEANLIVAGKNYGYPKVSNGSHYDGRDIPDHKPGDGFEAPKMWWNPSISPAGLMIYSGDLFPAWKGDAFLGGLSSRALLRVDLDGTNAKKGDQWDMGARIREVEQGPDGAIWVLEDGDDGSQGRLIKLTPKG